MAAFTSPQGEFTALLVSLYPVHTFVSSVLDSPHIVLNRQYHLFSQEGIAELVTFR